jgi:hypothetical protein
METATRPTHTREIEDEEGGRWTAFAAEAIVAHGKPGAALAFRPTDHDLGSELRSTITFNSMQAAAFAIRTMSDKELRRRLSLARMAAGGV